MQVDVGVEGFVIFRSTRADLENRRCAGGSILQMMTIGGARREARAVTAPQQLFAGICYKYDFALEDVHKLVLLRVADSIRRPKLPLREMLREMREHRIPRWRAPIAAAISTSGSARLGKGSVALLPTR